MEMIMSKLLDDLKAQVFSLESRGYIQEPKRWRTVMNHVEMLEDIVEDTVYLCNNDAAIEEYVNIDEKIKKFKEEFYNIGIGLFL
jgi:tyrosine-protein phosphatase YwqE